ncbi:MAG: zinc ribbon domain-containing protein [Lachnospiraceae bacterium]|nr:zinc ribbon domain-containing protein [Lachnospiraceae bacterium]
MNCSNCGNQLEEGITSCTFCGQPVNEEPVIQPAPAAVTPPKKENMVTGIVGALLGAALGAIVIILLGQMGFIASISGWILAVCTFKGYELFGRRLSFKGVVICLVLIVVTPYFADRLNIAIMLCKEIGDNSVSVGEVYAAIPDLIKEGFILQSEYIKSLLMLYVFAALGAFGTVRDLFRK